MLIKNLSVQFPGLEDYYLLGGIMMGFMEDVAFVTTLERGIRLAQAELEGFPG